MKAELNTDRVREFHTAMGLPVDVPWNVALLVLRDRLHTEEFDELSVEILSCIMKIESGLPINKDDKARLLKELSDLKYVIDGTAIALGLGIDSSDVRVHKSNMSKLGDDGKPIYREDGKVMKSNNYKPANLIDLV